MFFKSHRRTIKEPGSKVIASLSEIGRYGEGNRIVFAIRLKRTL